MAIIISNTKPLPPPPPRWTYLAYDPPLARPDSGRLHVHILSCCNDVRDSVGERTEHLEDVADRISSADPIALQFSTQGHDWEASDWMILCEALHSCRRLQSFKFYVPYCGMDQAAQFVLPKLLLCMPFLKEVKITDGLEHYEPVLDALAQLPLLKRLYLQDASFGVPLPPLMCQSLARSLRSMVNLEVLRIGSLLLDDPTYFAPVLEEIQRLQHLEVVDIYGLTNLDGVQVGYATKDFCYAHENERINQLTACSTDMGERLAVLLELRGIPKDGADAAAAANTWTDNLHSIADRSDYSFHWLRCLSDPGRWAGAIYACNDE